MPEHAWWLVHLYKYMRTLLPLPQNKREKTFFIQEIIIMAPYHSIPSILTPIKFCLLFSLLVGMGSAQLSSTFYAKSCPNAVSTIKSAVDSAVSSEARMGASLLRLHFHDCFVNASHLSLSSSFIFNYFFISAILCDLQMSTCVCVRELMCIN